MKKTGRDNFSSAVIKILERRVNAKCSAPECRVPTSGPTKSPGKANNVGVAAHITAAAPGGPRYDAALSSEQRASIDNAIWLCASCSTKIDKDTDKYTVQLLNEWKRGAEAHAEEEFGKAPLSRQDYLVLESLALGRLKKNQLSDAVSRIGRLTTSEMEKLDPRFSVDVGYNAGTTSYTFHAKEPVSMTLGVTPSFASEFQRKYAELVEHGKDVEIASEAIWFEGSPLFAQEVDRKGKLVISTHARKPAVVKCTFEGAAGQFAVDDVHGELVGGAESVTFKGKLFGGIIELTIKVMRSPTAETRCTAGTTIDFSSWNGRSVRSLPYFEKAKEFYASMQRQERLEARIEIEGQPVIAVSGVLGIDSENDEKSYWIFRHLRNARALLKLAGQDAIFYDNFSVDPEQIKLIEEVYQTLFSQAGLKGKKLGVTSLTVTLSPDVNIEEVKKMGEAPGAVKYEREFDIALNLFGHVIHRPKIQVIHTSAKMQRSGRANKIKPGGSYKFKICPTDECEFLSSFVT